MKKMFAGILEEYGHFEWKEIDYPTCGDDEVIVKLAYASICGSDQHIFAGEFHPRTPIPFVPGHEFSGHIHQKGKNVTGFEEGDQVTVDPIIWCGECPACKREHYPACTSLKLLGIDMNGGFGQYVKAHQSSLFKIDKKVTPKHAALAELYSIGFHSCNRAGVKEGDNVAIWGAGKVGQAILQAVKTKTNARVIVVDILPERLDMVKKGYADVHILNAKEGDPIKQIYELTDGKGVDIAIEAIGHYRDLPDRYNPIRSCIKSIRGAGTVCVLGLSDEPTPLLMKELIWKEARLVASRVSHGEFTEAIENLEKGKLQPDLLITDILAAKDIQKGFELLEAEPENHLKVLLEF